MRSTGAVVNLSLDVLSAISTSAIQENPLEMFLLVH